MSYRKFLRQHVFKYDDYIKDIIKVKFSSLLLPRQNTVRIIYYHYVFPENYMNFLNQIDLYDELGFCTLSDANDSDISLTFDDTYRLNKRVFEHLRHREIPVTLFVSPAAVVNQSDIYSGSTLSQFTVDDLKYLRDIGVSLQNHTYSHSWNSNDRELIFDFERAQHWFDQTLSISCDFAALPRGDFPKDLKYFEIEMKKIGINCTLTTSRSAHKNHYFKGRHHIMPHWPVSTIKYFMNV